MGFRLPHRSVLDEAELNVVVLIANEMLLSVLWTSIFEYVQLHPLSLGTSQSSHSFASRGNIAGGMSSFAECELHERTLNFQNLTSSLLQNYYKVILFYNVDRIIQLRNIGKRTCLQFAIVVDKFHCS